MKKKKESIFTLKLFCQYDKAGIAGEKLSPNPILLPCLFFSIMLLFGGCATENATAVKKEPAASLITDFLIVEDAESFSVIVKGDRPLTYAAMKQSSPMSVYLQFPQTGLDRSAAAIFTPQSDLIDVIRATESKENGSEALVFIDLKSEIPYKITAEGNDLRIVFTKPQLLSAKNDKARIKTTGTQSSSAAAILKKVVVTTGAQEVNIRVMADGVVKDCRTFTIETPPKIVVDCFDLKSNYEKQQKIAVKSAIVSQVRHFGHPDRVRVVAETQGPYLNSYLVEPEADGFAIKVGTK